MTRFKLWAGPLDETETKDLSELLPGLASGVVVTYRRAGCREHRKYLKAKLRSVLADSGARGTSDGDAEFDLGSAARNLDAEEFSQVVDGLKCGAWAPINTDPAGIAKTLVVELEAPEGVVDPDESGSFPAWKLSAAGKDGWKVVLDLFESVPQLAKAILGATVDLQKRFDVHVEGQAGESSEPSANARGAAGSPR